MKTKAIIFMVCAAAAVTLSFVQVNKKESQANAIDAKKAQVEVPVGGFVSADPL